VTINVDRFPSVFADDGIIDRESQCLYLDNGCTASVLELIVAYNRLRDMVAANDN
jgi:hypothetical protein